METVNISYLHNFKQIFIEDLSTQNTTQEILRSRNMYEVIGNLGINKDD